MSIAQAQEPPPATAPTGVTTVAPAPLPETPPTPPAVIVGPAPAAAPAPQVIVAPAPAPAPVVTAAPPPPVAPPSAPTPAWSPVFTGSYFTRYEVRNGFDDLSIASPTVRPRFQDGDALFYRLRFGLGTGLIDVGNQLKVGLQFTPQATGTFGNLTSTPAAPNTTVDANLGLHEGYARVQGAFTRFDAGRFELNYGDSLIVGNLDWNEVGRSFDGARVRFAKSPTSAWVDVFATLIDEGRPDQIKIAKGDIYFLGAYGAFGPAITKGLDLDVYALARVWGEQQNMRVVAANPMPTYRRDGAAEATIGVRAKQKLKLFDYRFEAGVQAGSRPGAAPAAMAVAPIAPVENVDVRAYHADLELGVSASDRFRVSLEGLVASGDDPTTKGKNEGFDELFPTAHKFLGLSDAFAQGGIKRTNVASGVLHLTAAATKALTLQVDGHLFSRLEKSAAAFNQKGFAGGEVDLGAVYVLAKGLKVRALYAIFVPDSDLYHDVLPTPARGGGTEPVQFAEVELRYDLMP